jgi:hypothetical protein
MRENIRRRDRLGVTGRLMTHPELGDLHCAGRHPDRLACPLSLDGCLSPSSAIGLPDRVLISSGAVCALEAAAAGKGIGIEIGKPSLVGAAHARCSSPAGRR